MVHQGTSGGFAAAGASFPGGIDGGSRGNLPRISRAGGAGRLRAFVMNGLWIVLAAAGGAGAAWWFARRHSAAHAGQLPSSEGPPLLDWILRANGALGAWLEAPGRRQVSRSTQ